MTQQRPDTPASSPLAVHETHVNFLDSVRGLAALSVLIEHYVISFEMPTRDPFWQTAWDYSPLHVFWDGAAAVALFFVLSGLVLSLKHFRTTRQPNLSAFDLGAYFLGRCFRLGPPYWVTLIISATAYALTTGGDPVFQLERHSQWLNELWGHPVGFWGMVREANLLSMPDEIVMVPQSWTLAIELLYSLLIPAGILLAARSTGWLLVFAAFAIKLLDAPTIVWHFSLGIAVAKHYGQAESWLGCRTWLRRLLLLAGIILYTAGDTFSGYLVHRWVSILSASGAALILICLIGSIRARAILSWPMLRFVGRVSFSFYLLHMLVLLCFMPLVWRFIEMTPGQSVPVWWLGLFLCTGLSLGIAALSYRFVEVPSVAGGKAFVRSVHGLLERFNRGREVVARDTSLH